MYGTIMRARVKPDRREEFERLMADLTPAPDTGFIGVQIGWEDKEPNRLVAVAVFKDRQSYVRNAERPDTDQNYRQMLEHLEGEPEWIDVQWAQYIGTGSGQGANAETAGAR